MFCEKEFDWRNYAERPRKRIRNRPDCKECVKQGLKGLAQNAKWCEGYCKKHAREKGLKNLKKKNKTKKKLKKKKLKKKSNGTDFEEKENKSKSTGKPRRETRDDSIRRQHQEGR